MNILVTGASRGIGKACVKNLISREGINVFAVSRSEERLDQLKEECLKELGREVHIKSMDFLKAGFQIELKNWLESETAHIDGLINNAGMLVNKVFSKIKSDDIANQFQTNFEGPLLIIQSCMPLLMNAQSTAHVVNIGSMGGFQGSEKFPGLSVYSASKAALATLTECLAAEYVNDGVCFNCLALGSADTEMLREAFPDYKSPMSPAKMAIFISDFVINGHKYFNGKVIPVSGLSA